MPHSGGFPIGLDWKHAKETRSPIHEYESIRLGRRKSSNDLEPISEERRREIAEAKGEIDEELEEETDSIRNSRTWVSVFLLFILLFVVFFISSFFSSFSLDVSSI